jgi:hypothetical protein
MAETQPIHISTLNVGIDQDTNPELTGSQTNGKYLDANNMRPVSTIGSSESQQKFQGEEILYPNNKGVTGYKCIGTAKLNDYIIEIFAKNGDPGIICVNGTIVLQSSLFDAREDKPFQISVNESEINQEILITDYYQVPYIFNVKDMVDSLISDPNKYFSAFDPLLYQINLQSPLDRLEFIELVNVGGGGGLPVGQYEYQMRYGNEEGDRTGWSVGTPLIPVMQNLSNDSRCYPWTKTYGGPPNPSSVTSLAPRLKFRVTNIYNYEFIEIRRIEYNKGAGIDFVPLGKIVARIPIEKQEISVKDYIDPSDANLNIDISRAEASIQLAEVNRAKSIQYFDRRAVLFNVELASKESSLEFEEVNGRKGFPVIDNLGWEGHKDPWNHVNRRALMGGEKYGWGVNLFDGVGTSGFVTKIPTLENYEYPNRRDPVPAETENYSYQGTVRAANSSINTVSSTHEVFDLADAAEKTDICSFKNILKPGKTAGLTGTRSTTKVKEDCNEDNGEIENHGANVSGGSLVSAAYHPFHPTKQNDTDVTGHEYMVNTKVYTQANGTTCSVIEDNTFSYSPAGFAPRYFAHGMMIAGVSNFPKWAKAFSVVRTKAAGRVVCQGLGFYSLTKAKYKVVGNQELAGKEQDKFWFYSPDIEHGIVPSDTLNDIIDNPQNYRLQFVSPLGFFSEVYSFEDSTVACNRDRIVDMISYVRMIREENGRPINPGEDAAMGISDGGHKYVTYDKYRNTNQNPNVFGSDPNVGNKLFTIDSVKRKSEGRGNFLEIKSQQGVYGKASVGGVSGRHFADQGLKDFTEPMYIINIIREGANVGTSDVEGYKPTNHYQKLESIIGRSNGVLGQDFELVDERWEDCIPAPASTMYGASTERYIYIKKLDGTVEKYVNVTYKTPAQIVAIKNAISINGSYTGGVTGIFTHYNIGSKYRRFGVSFNDPDYIPPVDSLILVRYDNTAPIRVYGGDTYVGETIFAPIDSQANAKSDKAETQFPFGIGFPYFKWKTNPRYYTIRDASANVNLVQDELQLQLGYIRQMCAMFTVESRIACHLAHNLEYPNQFFPAIHYVIRPNRWDNESGSVNYSANKVYDDYADDYGDEMTQWKWGGFRFLQQINPDYSCELPIRYFSKPESGFVEQTEFKTGIMWSLPRAINVQNSPGLRTFPVNNFFSIDDNCGEIKYGYNDTTSKGENLYAITNSGICLLITKKSILSDFNSGEVGYMAADGFILAQYWLNKQVGMNDEMWRSAVSAYVPFPGQDGAEQSMKALFFANNRSVYRFAGNEVVDIGKDGYYRKVYHNGLKNIATGFTSHVTAAYNQIFNEYMLRIHSSEDNTCLVFSQKKGKWIGTTDFKFERFTSKGNLLYGTRDLETYELNKGYVMNGEPVRGRILGVSSPEQVHEKEWIYISVNSIQKPTQIEFYKVLGGAPQCVLSQSNQGSLYLKKYSGWRQFIPRIFASVSANRPRLQGRMVIWHVEHYEETDFIVVDVSVQYKILKLK